MDTRSKCTYLPGTWIRCAVALLFLSAAHAQDSKSSGTFSLNQDVFFGFYPQINGAYSQSDTLDWTYYGIFWTTPSFGTGGGGGLWTEFGGGVNFKTMEGKLQFNPQLGVLNGKLLSNGNFPVALEGVVPNITVNLNTSRAEGQFYLGYYLATRKGKVPDASGTSLVSAPVQNNFVHWWGNGGVKLAPIVSAGLHYEALYYDPSGTSPPSSAHLYRWLGPYVQASLPNNISVRFTAGSGDHRLRGPELRRERCLRGVEDFQQALNYMRKYTAMHNIRIHGFCLLHNHNR